MRELSKTKESNIPLCIATNVNRTVLRLGIRFGLVGRYGLPIAFVRHIALAGAYTRIHLEGTHTPTIQSVHLGKLALP